jgi:c-di-GMP-binding flagellar brake protein YcgR
MQFSDLRIQIATRMQLVITGVDYKPQTVPAQLMGYRTGVTLLAYVPKKPATAVQRAAKVSARVGLQSAIIQFDSIVEHISELPFYYLHLKYPDEVVIEQQLRRSPRFNLDVPVTALEAADKQPVAGHFADISLNGARLVFPRKLVADEVTLTGVVFVVGAEQQLNLKAKVKNVGEPPTDDSQKSFIYGASFIDVPSTQQLLLQALCYELQSGADN